LKQIRFYRESPPHLRWSLNLTPAKPAPRQSVASK
jgi:hypothetical protein